jgi:hypothetical protein
LVWNGLTSFRVLDLSGEMLEAWKRCAVEERAWGPGKSGALG